MIELATPSQLDAFKVTATLRPAVLRAGNERSAVEGIPTWVRPAVGVRGGRRHGYGSEEAGEQAHEVRDVELSVIVAVAGIDTTWRARRPWTGEEEAGDRDRVCDVESRVVIAISARESDSDGDRGVHGSGDHRRSELDDHHGNGR